MERPETAMPEENADKAALSAEATQPAGDETQLAPDAPKPEVKNNDEAKESAKAQLDSLKQQYESQSMDFKTVLSNYGYDSEDQLLDEMIVEANKEIVAKKYIRKAISDDEINKYYEDEIYGDYNAKHILIKADTSDDASKEEQEKATILPGFDDDDEKSN